MNRRILASAVFAALCGIACGSLSTTSPAGSNTTPTLPTLAGTWSSVSSLTVLTNTCSDFKWQITTASATGATGTFTALCAGNLTVTGTATGTLSGGTITWTATANGTSPALTSCAISLTGTAVLEPSQIRVTYSGTTCLGPVSGTEILRE